MEIAGKKLYLVMGRLFNVFKDGSRRPKEHITRLVWAPDEYEARDIAEHHYTYTAWDGTDTVLEIDSCERALG